MRILIVEDNRQTINFISKGLEQEGFAIDCATNGETGLHMATTVPYDIAIIDIMLPKLNGLELVEKMRKQNNNIPVIILSAKSTVDDRIKGLQAGGDDYLVKPFAFSELVARIQAIIRRATNTSESTTLSVGDMKIDISTRKVTRNNVEIELQPKEFSLLEYLMRNDGRVVSKTMIMEHVWDYNFDPRTTVVESRVCHLREKIDRNFNNNLIQTIRGVGYVIKDKQ